MQFQDEVTSVAEKLNGRLGLSVQSLSGNMLLERDAQTLYPTASTMKVPLLVTLFERVLNHEVDLATRVTLEEKDLRPGGGILRTFVPGLNPTIRDLATAMIILSDNTATDYIFRLVGIDSVNRSMRALGLDTINVVLTAHDILYDVVGLSEDEVERMGTSKAIEEFFRRRRESIYNPNTISHSSGFDNDVASPHDLARLAGMIANHKILTPQACDEILRIMKLQLHRHMIPKYLPKHIETATKAGGVETVRADVGVVFASTPYTLCVMTKELTSEAKGEKAIAQVSKHVFHGLEEQVQA